MAKQSLGGGIERPDDAAVVDHHRRVRHGIENRTKMCLARPQIAGGLLIVAADAVKLLAEPGDAYADDREYRRLPDLRLIDAADDNPGDQTESCRHQTWAQSADARREQNGRDEQEKCPVSVQPRTKPEPQQKQQGNRRDSEPVVRCSRLRIEDQPSQSFKIAGFGLKRHSTHPATLWLCYFWRLKPNTRPVAFGRSKDYGHAGAGSARRSPAIFLIHVN